MPFHSRMNRYSLRGCDIWWIDAQRNGSSESLNRNYYISGTYGVLSRETLNSRQSLSTGMCAITGTILLSTTCKLNFPSMQPTSLNIRAPQEELQCLTGARCDNDQDTFTAAADVRLPWRGRAAPRQNIFYSCGRNWLGLYSFGRYWPSIRPKVNNDYKESTGFVILPSSSRMVVKRLTN